MNTKNQNYINQLKERGGKIHSRVNTKYHPTVKLLKERTDEIISKYLDYTGLTLEDFGGPLPMDAFKKGMIPLPTSSCRSKLVQEDSYFHAFILLTCARVFPDLKHEMPLKFFLEWADSLGYLRGIMSAANFHSESGSFGGNQRAQVYQARFSALLVKCDELFPDWRKSKRPSADKMAEEMIGMFEISHRGMADEIRNARKMYRAAQNAQNAEHAE